MLELEVILDFTCCNCGDPLGVTLKCTGSGLFAGKDCVASVKVPCPNCHEIIHIAFSPDDGTLHEINLVGFERPALLMPEPSFN